jgi:alkanesulfonate monooxygenase SsuD/methylene tetrahydromethanopterin reductase-like flavin-dependent oxidoreductase (luciferase family)
MTLTFDWFLPTSGDGRTIYGRGHSLPIAQPQTVPIPAERPPDIEYLGQVARAAEQLGFAAVLTPTGTWCEDAWLATAALITATSRLKFLVAFRPGLISPTLAAQMAASYQRISRGRLLLNVVTGGQAEEQRRFGDHLSHDERYARTGEFLAIVRGAWSGHRAGRQPRAGGRPDRGVRGAGHLGVHPVRVPAPGGGVLVRRGRAARATQARALGTDDAFVYDFGGYGLDEKFFPHGDDVFRGRRVHQVRLGGGDASSDSYCYPSE